MSHMLKRATAVLAEAALIEQLPFRERTAEKLAGYDKLLRTLESVTKCLDRMVASDFRMVQLRSVLRTRTDEYVGLLRQMEKQENNIRDLSLVGPIMRARIAVTDVLAQIDAELARNAAAPPITMALEDKT